jgi:Fe-Mn family superoxide dismutase
MKKMKMRTSLVFFLLSLCAMVNAQFFLPPLPYNYNALEPYIDEATMKLHHDVHHKTYIDNLNKALEKATQYKNTSLEELISNINKLPESIKTDVRNNGGGHYNHYFFWNIMTTPGKSNFSGPVAQAIIRQYGSLENFESLFEKAATSRFGSGWAWLIVRNGRLDIISTPNQDNPLMDIAEIKGTPILALDVWEHAYYLKYQSKRADYIKAFWNVVNWDEVNRLYTEALKN